MKESGRRIAMENEHGNRCQENIDHLATVLLNVVKMNRPWRKEDLKHLADYVKTSSIDETLQRVVLIEIVKAVEQIEYATE